MGKLPDEEVADRTGHSTCSIQTKRCKLGIYVEEPKFKYWTPEEDALLGTDSDKAMAAKIGRTIDAVYARRLKLGIPGGDSRKWKPEDDRCLGTASDREIAKRLNRSEREVLQRRHHLRIHLSRAK